MRWLIAIALVAGCLPRPSPTVTNVVDLQYRTRASSDVHSAIRLYRWFGSKSGSVKSRCKMLPTDSENFAIRASRCNAVSAWYWGISRVLLEESASAKFLHPLRVDGRRRWVDLPGPPCGP
jgi:hypothetical protein